MLLILLAHGLAWEFLMEPDARTSAPPAAVVALGPGGRQLTE